MAKAKSAQNFLVWMLMGLLVAGLAGFGIDGFLTQRVTSIGSGPPSAARWAAR